MELPTSGQARPPAGRQGRGRISRADLGRTKKNAKKQKQLIIFADESGLSEKPSIRSTWGRQGETPVVVHSHSWAKRSMMGGLIYHWDGTPVKLTFEIIEKSYNLELILRWCQRLVMLLAGAKAVLIWDRLQAHRSKAVRDYLAEHGITVVLLPGYSPHLNPTEWLWANLKGTELANYCPDDIKDAEDEARRGIKRIRRKIPLLTGFLAGAGLSFGK
jgi:transposase